MLDLADKVRLTVEQAARIMDEYKHRLSEVLEQEIDGAANHRPGKDRGRGRGSGVSY